MIFQDYQNFLAAFVGSVIGASRDNHKNVLSYILSVITGTASSVYLTPIIASMLQMTDAKYMLGLSFLVGTLGLKTIEFFSKRIQTQLEQKKLDSNL
jgi:hypothetical protein